MQEPRNRIEFEHCLLLGVVLQRERVERISHALILGRVDSMRFYCSLTETPLDPTTVMPLEDMFGKPRLADHWD